MTFSPRNGVCLSTVLLAVSQAAIAGPAPSTCTAFSECVNLESDLLYFREGDPTYEIATNLTDCSACSRNADGSYTITGSAEVIWGPYDPTQGAICTTGPGGNDRTTFSLSNTRIEASGVSGGGERVHVPQNPLEKFYPTIPVHLTTACVSAANLDYRIPFLELSDNDGAITGEPGIDPHAALYLPANVRARDAGGITSALALPKFPVAQNLAFMAQDTADPNLRIWPDGLPFRLGPYRRTFTQILATMTTDAVNGPPPYTPHPPQNPDLTALQTIECDPAKPDSGTDPCNATTVSNAGYFDSVRWAPVSDIRIDIGGLDVDLDFPPNEHVTYETLYPRGVWVRLDGPATMSIVDGAVASGSFREGSGWLRMNEGDLCGKADRERTFVLRGGVDAPRLGADGSLMAGVDDLTTALPLDWSVHQGNELGCGTLFVPPVLTDDLPQKTWQLSGVPTILDRGVYAGYNYNRNQVCHDASGVPLPRFCAVDADCGIGEQCLDGGFAPHCPALTGAELPEWDTQIEGVEAIFPIYPGQAGFGDREMALVARLSGVTGVFDGGDSPFNVTSRLCRDANDVFLNKICQIDAQCDTMAGETCQDAFSTDFSTYGLAFKQSRSEGQDTIVRGNLTFDWPASTLLPFEEMSMCNCGSMDAAESPETPVESTLKYWNASFLPSGLDFTDNLVNGNECPQASGGSCSESGVSTAVCVTALTPVPRIEPDPTSQFPLLPDGNTGVFLPFSGPDVEFDRDAVNMQSPYTYHLESFGLNTWSSATGPLEGEVVGCDPASNPNCKPYGYYDLAGDLSLPYFGLHPAGIQLQPEDRDPNDPQSEFFYPANLHEEGDPAMTPSSVAVSRKIAGDTIDSDFKVDYFAPDSTAAVDGDDRNFAGRGKLFAFAEKADLDLGVAHVAGGMIMEPSGIVHGALDLGPAAALRLWGATEIDDRVRLEEIIDPNYVLPYTSAYEAALAELMSERPYARHALPHPSILRADLLDTGAMAELAGHEHGQVEFNVDPNGASPPIMGTQASGWAQFMTADPQQLEFYEISSNQSSAGEFYAVDATLVQVDRHVKQGKMPIITQSRIELPGASQNMELPGEQSIPFPAGDPATDGSFFPGMSWDYDYDMPGYVFKSLTGSLDLTKGGLSGMGFDRMGATLKFFADGDWYFDAGLRVRWSGYSVKGDILLGNTVDMTPLRQIDPDVAHFLSGVDRFDGAYIGAGLSTNIWDMGCLLEIALGADVAGWYISDSFGGKLRGYVHGTGGCLVSVRGDITLLGGKVQSKFKMQGKFWVGGGIGFCDPEDWDSPADVLDDDFCTACAAWGKITGTYPPSDLDLKFSGPSVECAL